MSKNIVVISNDLTVAGVSRESADSVAAAAVAHSEGKNVTHAEQDKMESRIEIKLTKMEGKADAKMATLDTKLNILLVVCAGVIAWTITQGLAG